MECTSLIPRGICLILWANTVAFILSFESIQSIITEYFDVLVDFKDATTIKELKNACLFPCIFFYQIYCVIFSYIQFTFTQTSECFLSNGYKNMHVLASGPELQAVRLGYVFRRKLRRRGLPRRG